MKNISTLAILIGSINVSLLFTIYYNYNSFPPLAYLILSLCFLLLILMAEYQYRRFKLLEQQSAAETIKIYGSFLYLFIVGAVAVVIKLTMQLNQNSNQLQYQKYVFVSCFQSDNNLYFNMMYYLSNYILGRYYISMFKGLHNKFLCKELQGTETVVERREQKCTVCLSNIEVGAAKTVTKCGHGFHLMCLRKWLQVKNVCPLCKQAVLQQITIDDRM